MARKKEPERIDQNKAKIMESAKSLFLQKGIRQTSMEDIAGKAHICKATLYTCYPNRDAIKNDISLEAMQYLYDNADAFMINRDKIVIMGFSAGGHLAGHPCPDEAHRGLHRRDRGGPEPGGDRLHQRREGGSGDHQGRGL